MLRVMLKTGKHPKVVSGRLGHANIAITLDIYSHVLPGMQEAAQDWGIPGNGFGAPGGRLQAKPVLS